MTARPQVALVHDWLTGMRGGEKVLEVLCELFPDARLLTLLHVPGSVTPAIERLHPRQSFAGRIPRAARLYRHLLPLYPVAVELFDLDDVDLVISTSHCAAKSVVPTGRARHLCYCHSPMRYAWDQFEAYFGRERIGEATRLAKPVMAGLARWDARTSARVDRFIANSRHVAGRIRRYYNRRSAVIHPPVDTDFFQAGSAVEPDAAFLVVSALVPYKRLEIAIEACRLAGAPLRIVGQGPELTRLQREAGPDVEFLGSLTNEEIRTLYQRSRAVLLPGEEDFGIVPVEAQACGRPVIALGRGGATETVVHGETGLLVEDATPGAFASAIRALDTLRLDPARIHAHARQFSRERFRGEIAAAIDDLLAAPPGDARW